MSRETCYQEVHCFVLRHQKPVKVLCFSFIKTLHYRSGDSYASVINGSLRQKQPETQNQIKREAGEEMLLVSATSKGALRAVPFWWWRGGTGLQIFWDFDI